MMDKNPRRARPDFHPHYFTRDTPHIRIEDGYERPYRSPESWYEIENGIGWAEYRLGSGGGLGSDRHTDRLMDGLGWAGAVALVLIPGLAYPPLLLILVPLFVLSAITSGIKGLARIEDRIRAREAAEAAMRDQAPADRPIQVRAFPEAGR